MTVAAAVEPRGVVRLETFAGWHIDHAIAEAIRRAGEWQCPTVFDFNDVEITVEGSSSHGLIYRDWQRAMSGFMPGNKIGPHPRDLTAADLRRDARIQATTEKRRAAREMELRRQAESDQAEFAQAVAEAPPFDLVAPEVWEKALSVNRSAYGRGIFGFAEAWARLMQAKIDGGAVLSDAANDCCTMADKGYGITGFMYGAAVSILAQVWKHGAALNDWHNNKYGRPGIEGTVNPAVLVLSPGSPQ